MNRLGNVFITVLLLFVLGFLLYIINYDNKSYEVIYTDNLKDSSEVLELACMNDNKEIELITIDVNKIDYLTPLKYYNEYQNSLPINYYSPLIEVVNINKCEFNNEILFIEIDKIATNTNINDFINCLKLTYKKLGIKTIYLKVGLSEYLINI